MIVININCNVIYMEHPIKVLQLKMFSRFFTIFTFFRQLVDGDLHVMLVGKCPNASYSLPLPGGGLITGVMIDHAAVHLQVLLYVCCRNTLTFVAGRPTMVELISFSYFHYVSCVNFQFFIEQTPKEFLEELNRRLSWPRYHTYTSNNYVSYAYDAIWAIGLMLNRTAGILKETNNSKRIEDFSYKDNEMTKLFFDSLADTDFFGASVSCNLVYFIHFQFAESVLV